MLVGGADGAFAAALRQSENTLVQGLSTNRNSIEAAQAEILDQGLYGPVTVRPFDGTTLPFIDNSANLVIVDGAAGPDPAEIARILVPGGKWCTRASGGADAQTKARPADIDNWTHYLYDATGNPVSKDQQVAPPQFLQWQADPAWLRCHNWNPGFNAMVSAGNRLFYIKDNGPVGVLVIDETAPIKSLPERWSLCGRDAFNGLLLWQRPLAEYGWLAWEDTGPTTWGINNNWGAPLHLNRRVVADPGGTRLYAALTYRGPVSVIDPATGDLLASWGGFLNGNEAVDEILLTADGKLILRVRTIPVRTAIDGTMDKTAFVNNSLRAAGPERIVALDAISGAVLWSRQVTTTSALAPETLAAHNGRIAFFIYHDDAAPTPANYFVVCLDAADGRELWRRQVVPNTEFLRGFAGNLMMYRDPGTGPGTEKDIVVFIGGDGHGFDAATGVPLWTNTTLGAGTGFSSVSSSRIAAGSIWPSESPGRGYNPLTGVENRALALGSMLDRGHHIRCYRGKTTERYIITPHRGAEFVDLVAGKHFAPDWLRGACGHGVMPANGLLYVPPSPCSCYNGGKMTGFVAFRGDHQPYGGNPPPISPAARLQQGPAYGSAPYATPAVLPGDWPTYRQNAARRGDTSTPVPALLGQRWACAIGGNLSPPVIAGGRVFVVRKDADQILCLDAATGDGLWQFTAGGPVDSPPTAYKGVILFGCRDGHVYCLRAADGALVWKFRAAPNDRQLVALHRLESVWPAHGSVLVENDLAYVLAGRSSYLDGGIEFWALDPLTGAQVHHAQLDGPHPANVAEVTAPLPPEGKGYAVPGVRTDILSSDGERIFLFQKMFDLALAELPAPFIVLPPNGTNSVVNTAGQRESFPHVAPNDGFLDDTLNNRKWWVHSDRWHGWLYGVGGAKQGRLLVCDGQKTYAAQTWPRDFGRFGSYAPGDRSKLICDANTTLARSEYEVGTNQKDPAEMCRTAPALYSTNVPFIIDAMVLAASAPEDGGGRAQNLFIAGAEDPDDPTDLHAPSDNRTRGMLWAVDPATGARLADYRLPCRPVFDGLAAAGGRLYMATAAGELVCCSSLADDPFFDRGAATYRIAAAWGGNADGQAGAGGDSNLFAPAEIQKGFTEIAAGESFAVGCRWDGTVWAWGDNASGQLGDGTYLGCAVPRPVPGLAEASTVSAGARHAAAVCGGTVYCWGDNSEGQLGDGSAIGCPWPLAVSLPAAAVAVACGGDFTVALLETGAVYAWGKNDRGQLGDGSTAGRYAPFQIAGLNGVEAIAAGRDFALALLGGGSVTAWGRNDLGQLGDGSTSDRHSPVAVTGLTGAAAIAAGSDHALAALASGEVRAWGNNAHGQLGSDPATTPSATIPAAVFAVAGAASVAAGDGTSLALLANGTVMAWGRGDAGQIGAGGGPATFPEPLLLWRLDETSGATACNDGVGYSIFLNNMTNANWTPTGKMGGALAFNGTNAAIGSGEYAGASIDLPEDRHGLSLWFKTTDPNGGIFDAPRSDFDANIHDRELYLSNGKVYARLVGSTTQIINSPGTYADGKWHHVVHTYGASIGGQKLYIDNHLVASGSVAASTSTQQARVVLGHANQSTADFFVGTLDQVRIFDRPLTASDVAALYGEPTAAPPPDSYVPVAVPNLVAGAIFAGGTTCFAASPAPRYGTWKAANFTPQQQADPAISAPQADADGDGACNALEYIFQTSPLQATESPRITNARGPLGWSVSFDQLLAPEDAVIRLQASTDLIHWTQCDPQKITVHEDADTLHVSMVDSGVTNSTMFFRVAVEY